MSAQTFTGEYVDRYELARTNRQAGKFFFEPDTMRFFRSRVAEYGYKAKDGRVFFVTSEQFDWKSPRLYTVRVMGTDGDVDTIGEFQQYQSRSGANRAAQRLAEQAGK